MKLPTLALALAAGGLLAGGMVLHSSLAAVSADFRSSATSLEEALQTLTAQDMADDPTVFTYTYQSAGNPVVVTVTKKDSETAKEFAERCRKEVDEMLAEFPDDNA